MRKPEYLSPSSLAVYEQDPQEFYLKYLCEYRPPKFPQTQPMSVGSAFDAFVKSYLHGALFGPQAKDSNKYELKALFEAQVEKHNRDFAWEAGQYCFNEYKEAGALADLMLDLRGAVDDPRFEFDLKGEVNGYREGVTRNMGVVLMGKPDLRFINAEGAHCIFDFKVNGYCGRGNTSPLQGYTKLREREKATQFWYNCGAHKNCNPKQHKGMTISSAYFEEYSADWATQLSVYSWLMGENVGFEFIAGIDQIVGKNNGSKKPILRVASHRSRVSEDFQFTVLQRFQNLWGLINDEPCYFFRDVSFEESQIKQKMLEDRAKMFAMDEGLTSDERWILDISRGQI